MDITQIFLDLAIILFSTKALGMLMRKIGLPQVVGMVIAGLLIGPAIWGQFGWWSPIRPTPDSTIFLKGIAEIGVVMILFSAGLETDIKELKRSGLFATLIAFGGVIVPIVGGFLVAVPFLGGFSALSADKSLMLDAVFIGVILAATSVGITVETLKEMGKLKGKVGTIILSAAIIDDVIGIVVLSIAIGFKDATVNPWMTLLMTVLFFIAAIAVGLLLNRGFKWLMKKYPHNRRVPIFGLVLCFVYAFCAEKIFGIADITGAYVAGIMLSPLKEAHYIDRKVDINSYMIFAPVFFANIGINTDFTGFNGTVLLFSLLFVLVGVLGKIIGCGGVAKLCKFSWRESGQIGVGMIARGEVALVVCNKGIEGGLFAGTVINPIVAVIMLVIISSLLAPILLKLMFKGDPPSLMGGVPEIKEQTADGETETVSDGESITGAEQGFSENTAELVGAEEGAKN